MGPLAGNLIITENANLLLAFIIGIGFGFALEQAGFSSSRKLAGMFYGYDTTVLKVFFTAAIVALIGSLLLNKFGALDLSRVFVNHFYVLPAILGGVIMGLGFIMGGFCPGTGFSALAIGKIDALFYLAGGFFGALFFAEMYPLMSDFVNSGNKGPAKINDWLGISPEIFSVVIILIATAMFWIAERAEKKYARPEITNNI